MTNTISATKTRTRNPVQTRAKLLQATIDLLAEKGADALSLKEAARVANVSRGVAYQHFQDRDHLLREAKAWMLEQLTDSLGGELDPASTEDRVYHSARLILQNREATRVLLNDALSGQAFRPDQPLYKLLIASLGHMRSTGRARRDLDIEVLSSIMLGAVASIIMLSYQPNADIDSLARRFANEFTRLLQGGIFIAETPGPATPTKARK